MSTSTIADINVVCDVWTELFTASGVASGSNVVVQNKGSSPLLVQTNTSNTPPADTDTSGWALESGQAIKITSESYVFIRASANCCKAHVETA